MLILMRIMYYLPAMLKDQQKQFEELADKYDIKLDNKDIGDIKTDSCEDLLETLKMDEKESDELSKFDKEKYHDFVNYMMLEKACWSTISGNCNLAVIGFLIVPPHIKAATRIFYLDAVPIPISEMWFVRTIQY
uniref:Uncharacterized protein n=1 Tax=Glossina palpalis gambiensis TaxID=67801 RepID=A0A1B0BZ86_9MUSC